MILSLALKNILFYKSRSITTFVLTFVATLFFILYVALMHGSHNSMLYNALKVYTGAIEIYKKGYRDVGGVEYLLRDVANIEQKLDSIQEIESYTSRYETYGLLSHKEFSSAAMVAGIEPLKEPSMSQIKEALQEGAFLKKDDKNKIYMGVELAKKLHLKVGDEISFIGSASDNSFAADLFRVCGTFKSGSFEFDSTASFVNRDYFDRLMDSKNLASYISIKLKDLDNVDAVAKKIRAKLSNEKEVLSWKTLMHSMVQAMQVDTLFGYISISLFFVVIFFVIMIFGFINVSSRIRELGTLRCIGVSSAQISLLLFYEVAILALIAIALATPIASSIAYYFSVHPFVMEGMSETYKEYGIVSDKIPLSFEPLTIAWNVGVIFLLNLVSILYPIKYINKFKPIEATKHV